MPISRRTISPFTMPAARTTSGVGSIAVWPVKIRKDPTEVTTAVRTTASPKARETRRTSATAVSA